MVRIRIWPRLRLSGLLLALLFAGFALLAGLQGAWFVSAILSLVTALLLLRALGDCAVAMAACLRIGERLRFDIT